MSKARIIIRRTPPRTHEMTTTASRDAVKTNMMSYSNVSRSAAVAGAQFLSWKIFCYSQSLQLKPAYPNAHLKENTMIIMFRG